MGVLRSDLGRYYLELEMKSGLPASVCSLVLVCYEDTSHPKYCIPFCNEFGPSYAAACTMAFDCILDCIIASTVFAPKI